MGWYNDIFYYKIGTLKAIARNYEDLYSDAPNGGLFEVAEFKADFDRALSLIGRGHWTGEVRNFGYYKGFGKAQRVVIADILGLFDNELKAWGFYEVRKLRHKAYRNMVIVLNGENQEQKATLEDAQS